MKKYTYEQARDNTLEYFKGDELATNVFITKYALRDLSDNYYETTPDQMHHRLANQFSKIESKYQNPMSVDEIYELFKNFKFDI